MLFALWLLVFASSSQIMILSPILPQIGTQLNIPISALGSLVSAYTLMVGSLAIISGPISDKIGRRRILLLGTSLMTFALVMHHFVVGYYSFLSVRILAGIAGGILSGSAVAYIGDFFPYNRRGWATGWVMSGMAFGQIAGIPLGVLLSSQYGFKFPFYMFALAMGMTFILIWFRIPQPDVELTQGPLTIKKSVDNYLAMLRQKEIAAAAVAYFMMFMGLSFFILYLPLWLTESLNATPQAIATMFVVGGLANVLTGPQAGKLSDRIGRKTIVITSNLGLALVMVFTTIFTKELWLAYPLYFIIMVLVAMRISPFSALLTALVSDNRRGALMSLTVALGQFGFAIGGSLVGPLYTNFGFQISTLVGALAMLITAIVVANFVPEPDMH
ncbi:MAG: MFS transporter [bacterium]